MLEEEGECLFRLCSSLLSLSWTLQPWGSAGHCILHLTLGSSSVSLQGTNGFQGEDSLRVLFFPGPFGLCV